ncbi:MAG: PPC domain-containing protein, partial [Caldilineaceae bacterium]
MVIQGNGWAGRARRQGRLARALGVALVRVMAIAPAALAAPAVQEGEPTPLLLGQLASATLVAGEAASWIVETPDDGLYVLTSGTDDESSANFTVVIADEDGNEVYNDVLQTAELELSRGDFTIVATAAGDGEVTLFLTAAFGELSEDWGEGELISGSVVTEEDLDGTRYAELEIEDTEGWQQAFVVLTGADDDVYSAYISGEDVYESISNHLEEGALTFWTQGGDYTLEITPVEGGDLLTVVVLLGGVPASVNVDEETELVMRPGTREVAARFTVEEANRAYTVTLVGEDDLDVDMSVSLNPTQDTWSSYSSGTDESVTFVAPVAGDYFVRAYTSSMVEEDFPMTLLVEAGEPSAMLTPGVSMWGEVEEGGDAIYSLIVDQPNSLLTILLAANNDQDLDLSAQQVGEDGTSLSSLSTYTSGATEVIATTVTEPGTFQVTVSGAY